MHTSDFRTRFRKRIHGWTLETIAFAEGLPPSTACAVMGKQLLRSCTSVIANYVEAQSGSSRKDFTNFLGHALKSCNESLLWLSLLRDSNKVDAKEVSPLINEASQIARMLGSSMATLRGRRRPVKDIQPQDKN